MPYDFAFYQPQGASTTFTMGAAEGTPNALRLKGGLADRLSNVNESAINVGAGDAFWVGDVLDGQTTTDADAKGYKWTVIGGATGRGLVGVTGTVGPGEWLVQNALLSFGYEIIGSPSGPVFGDPLATSGIIDSLVTSELLSPGGSTWTFHGVEFRASRCENLDFWYANRDVNPNLFNYLRVSEYFEARMFFLEGSEGGNPLSDRLEASFKLAAAPESGLRVLQFVGLSGTNPSGNDGPWIQAGEMLVRRQAPTDAPAVVRIEDASQLHVMIGLSDLSPPETVKPKIEDASILQYGTKHVLFDEEQDVTFTLHRNYFLVQSKETTTPGSLTLDPTSMITALGASVGQDPYVPGSHDLLHEMNNSDFVIQSQVSALPARGWHTGDVDLFFWANLNEPLDFEVIAEDVCNLWFVDVPEPRCLKHWRNLVIDGPELVLVDQSNNHVCEDEGDDALYIVEDIFLRNSAKFNVNGTQVYYGGSLNLGNGSIDGSPAPLRLKKSLYGDFNGDCFVNAMDVTIISDYVAGLGPKCDWPLGDWNGDCTVDVIDLNETMQRASDPSFTPLPGCQPMELISCPVEELGGGEGGGGPLFASSETISAFSDATVDFVASQDPVSDEEISAMTAAVSALGRIAVRDFSVDQRASLASALEAVREGYRNATTRRLANILARSLRE